MEQQKFGNALARAQRLMLDEGFNQKVEGIASAYSGKNSGSYGTGGDLAALEAQAFGTSYSQEKPIQMLGESSTYENNMRTSKLPKAVLDSVRKTPLMSGDDGSMNSGVAETMNALQMQQPIREQRVPAQQGNTGGIDYSLIKSIVDESVRRNLKGKLNESAGFGGVRISKQGVVQFIDSKGNLYEGVLKLKKAAGTK